MFGFVCSKALTMVVRLPSLPPFEMKFEYVIVTGCADVALADDGDLSPALDEHAVRVRPRAATMPTPAMTDLCMVGSFDFWVVPGLLDSRACYALNDVLLGEDVEGQH